MANDESIIKVIQRMVQAGESRESIIKALRELGVSEEQAKKLMLIAEADTLACFSDITGIFQAAFCWEGHKSRSSALNSVKQKLERKWNQLHFDTSKKIIRPKYEAAMLLLKEES